MHDIMPLHLLKTGTVFLLPDEGEDSFFKVISKDIDTITVENTAFLKQKSISPLTMVVTENKGGILSQYATFDTLSINCPFMWRQWPYIKINDKEAICLAPTMGPKKELLDLVREPNNTGRIPDIEEILPLAFIPILSNILSSDTIDNPHDMEESYLWYPIEKFTSKTVVGREWILSDI